MNGDYSKHAFKLTRHIFYYDVLSFLFFLQKTTDNNNIQMTIIIYRPISLLLFIIAGPIASLYIIPPFSTQLYVFPFTSFFGNDSDGSLEHPYSSLQQALDHVERNYHHDKTSIRKTTINLYPTHHFVNTIHFRQAHSHTRLTTMNSADISTYTHIAVQEYAHRRLPTASISGGVLVTGWTKVSGNTYSAVVPQLTFVNQLFVDNKRIVRSRVPMNHSDYLQYAANLKDPNQARYGFQYVPGQFDYKSLADAMVVVYHSWTESHHYIDRLITENNTVLFTNPSDRPIGTFFIQGQHRFHIENLCEALVPNSFCFVNETKTIYLMTDGSYDPTNTEIITSVNEIVVSIVSDDVTKPVEDVIIGNVAVQHGAWNIGRYEQADAASAAFLATGALLIINATSIVISNVEISHTGAYGLRIREGTSNIDCINSLVTDTGAGGIWIGHWLMPMWAITTSINVISNEVSYGGNVFPSAVGIIIHRGVYIVIADNSIHHHRYNGITVSSSLGYGPSTSNNVLIQGNYIYNIGQHILNDQGGIYTTGIQPGTVIDGNVIKNVFSYAIFMWGIYLDEGSSEIVVSNNIVYNTGWAGLFQHYGANNTIINNIFARASLLPPPQHVDPNPDGDLSIAVAENHTSWIFTRNIIYDTFQGTNHSVFKSPPATIASFSNNIYYNLYGTPLLFGSEQTSFDEWQKTGQDNGSVIADPLFIGDVNQCDFFTIEPNSPAAKLGFVNITKLAKWTPGCDMNDLTVDNQFYHW
jgi:parallel beta-helix repeat protein